MNAEELVYEELPSNSNTRQIKYNILLVIIIVVVVGVFSAKVFF